MKMNSNRAILAVCFFLLLTLPVRAEGIFVEAEAFADKGGWSVDQQFMDQMGSPYLIAHGMGVPVADASTAVEIPEAGIYHVWVRTYNWTAPWTEAVGPGAFRVKIDGKPLKGIVGASGNRWEWQYAGNRRLKAGSCTLALTDLKGFDGRCDAVWLTKEEGVTPPSDVAALEEFRRKVGALSPVPSDGGTYDLVVIGGGIAGICAAVSAARNGCKVALVNDRPVPGGNNSAEVRVHLGGRTEFGLYPRLGLMLREFGHSTIGNAKPAANYEDEKKIAFIENEPNVNYFPCFRAVRVRMDGHRIASVVIRGTETGEERELRAPLFADCTGDAGLGYMAGADWRMGREGRDEFGESLAPEKGDNMTMGASVQWYSVDAGRPTSFPEFSYGVPFTEENCEKVKMGEWTWETGMNRDQITEFERIRDYGLLVVYSNWSFLKNHYSKKADYATRDLGWVAYVAGKRESRRLMGDYILKQDDVDKLVFHEDASFTISWHFDLHSPDPVNASRFPEDPFRAVTKSNPIYPYAVPYRCLYSRNVDNLFMAGRNISTTHVTLGSTRLMRTGAMMGEVVGMAAGICTEHGVTPREVYQHYLPELKEKMTQGAARTDIELPDNQQFNLGGHLKEPKYITGRPARD